jgi:hypothetical protein
MEDDYQLGVQEHMQALTELRQYVRAEQNRPVLGASSENEPQAGGPGMGGLGSLLQSLMGGQGGGAGQGMMSQDVAGGKIPPPNVSPLGQEQEEPQRIPGSKRRRRKRRKGGLVEMPGMGNYPALMGGAGY